MGRILRPDELGRTFGDFERRLQKLGRSPVVNNFPLISTPGNSANQNQTVPPVGNFNGTGGTKYDVTMSTACVFTLTAPTPILWLSYATIRSTAPGGGTFLLLTTAVSISPWNPALVIFESGSQIFDIRNGGYVQSFQQFAIAGTQLEGAGGAGAPPLGLQSGSPTFGPLPAGTYEVRQRIVGDVGTQAAYYQGNIDVYAPGG